MRILRNTGRAAVVFAVLGIAFVSTTPGQTAPEQPIAFSHRVHAGDNQMPCLYCHVNARRSSVAGIPSVARCMGCHKITAANTPEVQKLKGYWDRQEPIPWTKITWMPDFVYFEHWPHVRADIACHTCHGPVETMERMEANTALTMKVCVDCHRAKNASIDCAACHR
jgi:hypothetical protein